MSSPDRPNAKPAAQDADENRGMIDSFEETLQFFWERNRNAVYALCVLVLAGIIGKGAWEYFSSQRRAEIGQAYAAATTPEMLKSFAAEHGDKPIGGAAELRIADSAYASGRASDAATAYGKAAAALPAGGPLAARARLGQAMAEIEAGRASEGEATLRQLSGDSTLLKSVRAEATYQLASLAADQGRFSDVRNLAQQIVQIDPSSPWTQRAFALQATHPAAAAVPSLNLGTVPLK